MGLFVLAAASLSYEVASIARQPRSPRAAVRAAAAATSFDLAAYMEETGLQAGDVDLQNASVLVGILFGAMLPFLFGALTMLSVGRAAEQIILQVRKQFYEVLKDLENLPPEQREATRLEHEKRIGKLSKLGCYAGIVKRKTPLPS